MESHIKIQYHAGNSAEVSMDKMSLTSETTWAGVEARVQEKCQLQRGTFTVESENGVVLGGPGTPLEWVREDQQRRPSRTVRIVRTGNPADFAWHRTDVKAATDCGLVHGVINAGIESTTFLSESIENSIQHHASQIQVTMDAENRRITIFDDGDGIPPEDLEAVGNAGASTVREEDDAAQITGALRIEEKTGSPVTNKLMALWGRYGVGRLSQLRSEDARVKYISVARDCPKIIEFTQDHAKIRHQTIVVYDPSSIDARSEEAKVKLAYVAEATGHSDLLAVDETVEDVVKRTHFTFIEITEVEESFFETWKTDRLGHLQALSEKYVLHLAHGAGARARSNLATMGAIDAAAPARLSTIIIDKQDLASAGMQGDLPNRVIDVLEHNTMRENHEQLYKLNRYAVTEEQGPRQPASAQKRKQQKKKKKKRASAEVEILTTYWPVSDGQGTRPEVDGVDIPNTFVFWNGLFMRDERLQPWIVSPDAKGSKDKQHFERATNFIFLYSSTLFTPEIHKRHLRSRDQGFTLLDAGDAKDTGHRQLRQDYRAKLLQWSEEHDREESYPISEDDTFTTIGDVWYRDAQKLCMASAHYTSGTLVKYKTGNVEKGKEIGYGRILKIFCQTKDYNDPTPTQGFAILASPLLHAEADKLQQVQEFTPATYLKLRTFPTRLWWRYAYIGVECANFVEVADTGKAKGEAIAEARKHFPEVIAVGANGTEIQKAQQRFTDKEVQNAKEDLKFPGSSCFAYSPPPYFMFSARTHRAHKVLLKEGFRLTLQAAPPSDEDLVWEDVRGATGKAPDSEGHCILRYPTQLGEIGRWHFRAVLADDEMAIWTWLAKPQVADSRKAEVVLENLWAPNITLLASWLGLPKSRELVVNVDASAAVAIDVKDPPDYFEFGKPIPALTVQLLDAHGTEAKGGSRMQQDFDLSAPESRCWLEVDGTVLEVDLTNARLARHSDAGCLRLEGAVAPSEGELRPDDKVLPLEGVKLHLQLKPNRADEEDWRYLAWYEPSEDGARVLKCDNSDLNELCAKKNAPLTTLVDLALAAFAMSVRLVPRTQQGSTVSLGCDPTVLRWANGNNPFVEPLRPREWVDCELELATSTGHIVGFEYWAKKKKCSLGCSEELQLKLGQTLNGGGIQQKVQLKTAYSWRGTLNFDIGDLELSFEASTEQREFRVSRGLARPPSSDISNDEEDVLEWTIADASLGALSLETIRRTVLKFEVVDERGVVDTGFGASVSVSLVDNTKQIVLSKKVLLDQGGLKQPLETLSGEMTAAAYLKAHRTGCSLKVEAKDLQNDNALLFTSTLSLELVAGTDLGRIVTFKPRFANLAIGEAAGLCELSLCDSSGIPLDVKDSPLRFTLRCDDPAVTLIEPPTNAAAVITASSCDLQGGWRLRRVFSADDNLLSATLTIVEVASGIEATCVVSLVPGECVEMRLSEHTVDAMHGQPFSRLPKWALLDVSGNLTDRHDGEPFGLDISSEDLELLADEEGPSTGSSKKRKKSPGALKAQVSEGHLEFESARLRLKEGPLKTERKVTLTPQRLQENEQWATPERVDSVEVTLKPSNAAFQLRIAKRRTGGQTAFPDGDDLVDFISTGAIVHLSTTDDSLLDNLEFTAFDEADKQITGLETSLTYQVPNDDDDDDDDDDDEEEPSAKKKKGKKTTTTSKTSTWRTVAALSKSQEKKWFLKSTEAPTKIFFRVGAARHDLLVQRVAGLAKRLQLSSEPNQSQKDLTQTFSVQAFDGLGDDALETTAHVKAHISTFESILGDEDEAVTATHAAPLLSIHLDGGDREAHFDVPHILTSVVKDCTNNKRPLDVHLDIYISISMEGVPEETQNYYCELENDLSKSQKSGAEKLASKEASDARERESRLKVQRRKLNGEIDSANLNLKKHNDQQLKRARTRQQVESLDDELKVKQKEKRALERAPKTTTRPRAAKISTNTAMNTRLETLRATLRREIKEKYIGFLSDLALVDNEAQAKALAFLCVSNTLYVEDYEASEIAKRVTVEFNKSGTPPCEFNVVIVRQMAPMRPAYNQAIHTSTGKYKTKEHLNDDGSAAHAINLMLYPPSVSTVNQKAKMMQIYVGALGASGEGPIIFDTAAQMKVAEVARQARLDSVSYTRISCDDPQSMIRKGGKLRIGGNPTKPPPFIFGAPAAQENPKLTALVEDIAALEAQKVELGNETEDDDDDDDTTTKAEQEALIKKKLRELEALDNELLQLANNRTTPSQKGAATPSSQKRPKAAASSTSSSSRARAPAAKRSKGGRDKKQQNLDDTIDDDDEIEEEEEEGPLRCSL